MLRRIFALLVPSTPHVERETNVREIKQYKVGDKLFTSGEAITFVVGQTDRAGVFLVAGDHIRWEFYAAHLVPPAASRARAKYEALWYELSRSTGKKLRRPLILQIANALFGGLHADSAGEVDEVFKIVEDTVHYNAKAHQAFRYLMGAVSALGLFGVIEAVFAYAFWDDVASTRSIVLAAVAGGIGAVLSVLQRLSSLDISPYAPLWYAFLQGMARVVLGVLFGVFFALANKANLVLGTFADNLSAVTVFGALSGISERFVPELIRKLESGEVERREPEAQPASQDQPGR